MSGLLPMTRVLQRAAEEWIWIETGQKPAEEQIRRADVGQPGDFPYSSTFRMEMWGPAGKQTFTVVVTESFERP